MSIRKEIQKLRGMTPSRKRAALGLCAAALFWWAVSTFARDGQLAFLSMVPLLLMVAYVCKVAPARKREGEGQE